MARSKAQIAADKKYRETHKGVDVSWGTRLKPAEAAELDEAMKQHGFKSRADLLRWAVAELKKQ